MIPSAQAAARSSAKHYAGGTERTVSPEQTLERARALMAELGITRIANVTHLDRVGVPVVAVYRPNARSLSVSQGKGSTLLEAKVSALMESIESHHAETIELPLRLDSHRLLGRRHRVVDVSGLPRLATSTYHSDQRLLWIGGLELFSGKSVFVPFESVHNDFRLPLPEGSGAFLPSSNGLASGNHTIEATSHGLCELIERDAQTLWNLSTPVNKVRTRVRLDSIDDPLCLEVLACFERAELEVGVWNTTSDVGVPSFFCTIADRDSRNMRPMPPASGAGCHPRSRIALLRALTEAAQSRLTIIAGARDDLGSVRYDAVSARASTLECLANLRSASGVQAFSDVSEVSHDDIEADVRWVLERLHGVGLRQAVVVDLTKPEYGVPVVRVIVPHLEALNGIDGYVPGKRARRALQERR